MAYNKVTTVAVIPARLGSRRVKYKNFQKLDGITLTERAVRFARSLSFIDKIILTSDADLAEEIAEEYDVVLRKRKPELSTGYKGSIVDVWSDALQETDEWGYSVLFEPSSPMRTEEDVIVCLDHLTVSETVMTVSPLLDDKVYRPNGLCYALRFDPGPHLSIYGTPTAMILTERPVVNIDTAFEMDMAEWMLFCAEGQ